MAKRWCVVAETRRIMIGAVLLAMRRRFPDVEFRLGKHRYNELIKGPTQTILGLMPTPHPNGDTQEVVDFARFTEITICSKGEK